MESTPHLAARVWSRVTGRESTQGAWRNDLGTVMVPLTLRIDTADGADVRLLLELWVRPARPSMALPPDQLAYTVVAPTIARWVAQHRLAELSAELGDLAVAEEVEEVAASLGAELLRVDVIAIEHLLLSPSAEPTASVHGSW